MTDEPTDPTRLRAALDGTPAPAATDDSDYRISLAVGNAFLARSKAGEATLLVPLPAAPAATGRRGGGFALNSVGRVVFRTGDRLLAQGDRSSRPDQLINGWRGPDGDPTDFFVDGLAVEVKASRRANVHHVSRRQVNRPAGSHAAYVLSMWAGIDPVQGTTVPEIVDGLCRRVTDAPSLLRRIAALGYAPADRAEYTSRFVLLEPPLWFRTEEVPQVRDIDAGISELRYVVALDSDRALAPDKALEMWIRFLGNAPHF